MFDAHVSNREYVEGGQDLVASNIPNIVRLRARLTTTLSTSTSESFSSEYSCSSDCALARFLAAKSKAVCRGRLRSCGGVGGSETGLLLDSPSTFVLFVRAGRAGEDGGGEGSIGIYINYYFGRNIAGTRRMK